MNYIVTARRMHLPTTLERPAMQPVTAIAEERPAFRDPRQQPSGFVYRGELLETASDKAYRPQYNLQISPENRRAINTYRMVADEPPVVGKILDGFI